MSSNSGNSSSNTITRTIGLPRELAARLAAVPEALRDTAAGVGAERMGVTDR